MHITPLLPDEEIAALPELQLQSLENTAYAAYTPLQKALLPHLDVIQNLWWFCLVVTMGFVFTRYILLPLLRGDVQPDVVTTREPGLAGRYKRIFRIHEIENDVVLRWFGGAILLGFLATFRNWQYNPETTVQGAASHLTNCWPFFQSCRDWIFLEAFPQAHSQMVFFMGLFALIVFAAYALLMRRYAMAHLSILVLFIAKLYLTLINFSYNANYDYYHTAFCIVFLFVAHKRFFASLTIVMLYVLSTVAKIHPGWTLGLYFTSLEPGMPIFHDAMVPFMTNLVIFMEMVMAWFLFSRRAWLQNSALLFFFLFHLYSGTLVGYHYPTMVLPALLILFGPLFAPFTHVPLRWNALPGWALMAALWAAQLISVVIPGDAKLTLEGNFYGLYMFEANHQCHVVFKDESGAVLTQKSGVNARYRCDPWPFLARAQSMYCATPIQPKIHFYMVHSINGGPFYEIVNEKDMCALSYKPFSRNDWIKDAQTGKLLGRARKNFYH